MAQFNPQLPRGLAFHFVVLLLFGAVLFGACSSSPAADPDAAAAALSVATSTPLPSPTPEPSPTPPATVTPEPTPTPTPTPLWQQVDVPELSAGGVAKTANGLLAPTSDDPQWLAVGTVSDRDEETYRPVAWTSLDPESGIWESNDLPLGQHERAAAHRVVESGAVRVVGGSVDRGEARRPAVWIDSGSGWSEPFVLPQIDGVRTSMYNMATDGSSIVAHTSSRKWPNAEPRTVIWKAAIPDRGDELLEWETVLEVGDGELRHGMRSLRYVGDQYFIAGWESDDEESWPVVWISPDGDTWEATRLASGGLSRVWASDVAWFDGEFIVAGAEELPNGNRVPLLWRSKGGEKWVRKKPQVTADFERVTTGGYAFDELVASGDQLFATTDHNFLAAVFRTDSVHTWDQLPRIADRSNDDDLTSMVSTPTGIALLQDGKVAQFADGEWTRTGGDLVGERDSYSLRAMASDGRDVLIAGSRFTADGGFPRLWTRRDGDWDVVELGGGGWITQVGAVAEGWLMAGVEEIPGRNQTLRLWQSSDLQDWASTKPWNDGIKTLSKGFEVVDGTPIAAVGHTRLTERNQIWYFPGLVRVGADITTADFGEVNYTNVTADGWYRQLSGVHCALPDAALFFHETVAGDPDETRAELRPAIVRSDLTVELGEPMRRSNEDEMPGLRECVGFAGRYWLLGTELPSGAGDDSRWVGALWSSADGLTWEPVDFDSGSFNVGTLDDVVVMPRGLLIVGHTDEQESQPVFVFVEVDPGTGEVRASQTVEPDTAVADSDGLSIRNVLVAGDELIAHGTEWGYNRVWSTTIDALMDSLEPAS